MKLLHVVPTYLPAVRYGGPIWAVHGLCRALVARGHEVHVYTTDVDGSGRSDVPLETEVEIDGVRVHYFACGWPRRLYRSPRMARRLRQDVASFDLVHCHSMFLWPPWAAARAARRAGRPYLVSPHGMLVPALVRQRGHWRKQAWVHLVDGPSLRSAAGIHVTTAAEAQDVAAFGFSGVPMHVVPFGVDVADSPVEEAATFEHAERSVLFLGRLSWKKGLDVVVAALAQVPGARLVVAGNDEEGLAPRLLAQARDLGLGDRVQYLGAVYGDRKQELLRSASVFVLASRGENFAMAALEAMAAGLPVVLSRQVGLAAEVETARAGLVVEATPPAVAVALRRLLAEPATAAAMGAAGRRLARDRFSWQAVALQMEAVALSLVGRQ